MYLQIVINRNFFSYCKFLLTSWRSMTKTAGSGSIINRRHGSSDPNPHQNVMDPQHCWRQHLQWRGEVWQQQTEYNKSQQSKNKTLPPHLNNDRILLPQPGQVPRDPMDKVVAKRLQIAPPGYLFLKNYRNRTGIWIYVPEFWIRAWIARLRKSVMWIRIQWGPWIRIRIRIRNPYPDSQSVSGFAIRIRIRNPDPDPGGPKLKGFSCSLDVLYGGLGISKLQVLNKKRRKNQLYFFP